MAVLLDAACMRVIFPHHPGHVPHPCHLARDGIGEDDLVGNLIFRILRRLHVDGYLLVIIVDAATHGGETLRLQTAEEQLLSDAVGLHPLTVYVERDLLLLFTEQLHVRHGGDAAQTV